ncbi:MAG TPA: TetR/AcrR family transcriptional regulator [Lachnospiraceae bacterium]|nr:TetR/AcrR family transcriptional regulator [Lachnospiraceae bacterium]
MSLEVFEKQSVEKQQKIVSTGIQEFSTKAYQDVSTDAITKACGISKGLLFHYFGSKKEFYIYCLDKALKRLMEQQTVAHEGGFYEILFAFMDAKILLCKIHPHEMHFVNMASRENAREVAEGIRQVVGEYKKIIQIQSMFKMRTAVSTLPLKNPEKQRVMEGLLLYVNAVIRKYLIIYQENPDLFFANAEMIKMEMKEYLELMLKGVCKEENK